MTKQHLAMPGQLALRPEPEFDPAAVSYAGRR